MIKKRKGVTLIEISLVAAVIGVIMIALAPYMRTIHSAWEYGDRRTETLQQGRIALDRMVKVIRSAENITAINANNITLSYNGNVVIFSQNGTNLVMQEGAASNMLAESVNNITFTYLDQEWNTTDNPALVMAVRIDMRLSDPQGELQGTLPLSSIAHCRRRNPN